MRLLTIFAAVIIMTTFLSTADAKSEETKTEFKYEVTDDLKIVHKVSEIKPGPSKEEIRLAEEARQAEENREKIKRDTLARERALYSPRLRYASDAEVIGYSSKSCVPYAKAVTGINHSIGDGAREAIQGHTPTVGAILAERRYVHAAVVESVVNNGVWATEANYIKGAVTRRFIPYSDIIGYVYR